LYYSELESDVTKLQKKLMDQANSLEKAVSDLEQLSVDLDRVTESTDRLGAQAKDLATFTKPVTYDSLCTMIAKCQVRTSALFSKQLPY